MTYREDGDYNTYWPRVTDIEDPNEIDVSELGCTDEDDPAECPSCGGTRIKFFEPDRWECLECHHSWDRASWLAFISRRYPREECVYCHMNFPQCLVMCIHED